MKLGAALIALRMAIANSRQFPRRAPMTRCNRRKRCRRSNRQCIRLRRRNQLQSPLLSRHYTPCRVSRDRLCHGCRRPRHSLSVRLNRRRRSRILSMPPSLLRPQTHQQKRRRRRQQWLVPTRLLQLQRRRPRHSHRFEFRRRGSPSRRCRSPPNSAPVAVAVARVQRQPGRR
jgi:hypothetical protein